MKVKISIISLLYIPFILSDNNQKCCKPDQHVVEKNTRFVCEVNPNKRIETNFEINDFFNTNQTGSCIDLYSVNSTAIFQINPELNHISKKEDIEVKYFPKCCHLGHRYNHALHSCVKIDGETENNITKFLKNDSFIKIGLPKCEIISDQILYSFEAIKLDKEKISLMGSGKEIFEGKYCVDSTLHGKLVVRKCEDDLDICKEIRCIHKCCPDGQSFVNGSNCQETFQHGVDLHASDSITNPEAPFVVIHGIQKPIYLLKKGKYKFSVNPNGIFESYMNKTDAYEYFDVAQKKYCIEYAYKENIVNGYQVFAGQVPPKLELKFAVTRWVKIVSCIFLILTIAVYLILPKMRNLFGKILVSYCIATFFFFFFLSLSQFFYTGFSNKTCKVMGFLSVLSSIWSFTWLHIMCIDIWFSFGSPRTLVGPLQKNELKRLLLYSLYGWGFPAVWVLLIAFFSKYHVLPKMMTPSVGRRKCYLENYDSESGNYAYLFFVTLPLLIQQVVNTFLFVKTIRYCLRIKAEIERMNDARKQTELSASRERLGLLMKLAVIMGVSFLFETISSIYSFQNTTVTKYIEVVWDTINCFQGLFIFIIFICKKKVYYSLCEKISILKSRKTSVSSSATTQVSLHQIGANKREKTP